MRDTHITPAPRHLLVRLPNPLGDAVLATPALRALRRALPDTCITWAGKRAALAALDGLDARNGIVPATGAIASGRAWHQLDVDAVLLLTHSWSSGLAAWLSRAPTRVGSGLGGRGRVRLLNHLVPLPLGEKGKLAPRSMTAMYLDLVRPFGGKDDGQGPRVVATAFDRRRAAWRLGDDDERPLLALNPGAAFGPSKLYPPASLAKALALVREEVDVRPLVLCGPGEEPLAKEVADQLGSACTSTHEAPPDIGELKGLLSRAAVCLGADSGPRHLSEALGVPTVVVMGPTDPRWTEHSRAEVVRRDDLDCLGCHLRTCPIGHPCLADLPPERVASAVLVALRKG